MKIVLLRVGIDAGSGGMQGPLFKDGSFEFIPIPDGYNIGKATYGNTFGRHGRPLAEYFPKGRQARMAKQSMHLDPEFESFTYGTANVKSSHVTCIRWRFGPSQTG